MGLRAISLFAGAAGLDLGIELACPGARTVCYVEREAYACAVLVARMEDSSLAPAPIWSDVATFDGAAWRGKVDLVHGGFPCQDISVVGKRAGLEGRQSSLWEEFSRIVHEAAPAFVFVENSGHTWRRWVPAVRRALYCLGYASMSARVRAVDVGADHIRSRAFVLAYSDRTILRDKHRRRSGEDGESPVFTLESRAERQPPRPPRRPAPPAVGRAGDDVADRLDRLRLTGNGVVPLQAAAAFTVLARRLGLERGLLG